MIVRDRGAHVRWYRGTVGPTGRGDLAFLRTGPANELTAVNVRGRDAAETAAMPHAHDRPSIATRMAEADPLLLAGYVARAHWRPGFGARDYRHAIRRGNDEPIPRPLALLLRMPAEPYPTPGAGDPADPDSWLPCLEREIGLHATGFAPDRRLARVLIEDPDKRLDPARRARLAGIVVHLLRGEPRTAVVPFRLLDVIGVGPGAIGRVERCVARNLADPIEYCAALARGELPVAAGCWLGPEELARGDLVATLVDDGIADLDRLSVEHGLDVAGPLADQVEALAPTLVAQDGRRLSLTPAGRADREAALAPLLATHPGAGFSPASAWRSEPTTGR